MRSKEEAVGKPKEDHGRGDDRNLVAMPPQKLEPSVEPTADRKVAQDPHHQQRGGEHDDLVTMKLEIEGREQGQVEEGKGENRIDPGVARRNQAATRGITTIGIAVELQERGDAEHDQQTIDADEE